jgi:hypothetical protein
MIVTSSASNGPDGASPASDRVDPEEALFVESPDRERWGLLTEAIRLQFGRDRSRDLGFALARRGRGLARLIEPVRRQAIGLRRPGSPGSSSERAQILAP